MTTGASKRLSTVARRLEELTRERDVLIVELRRGGMTLRAIAALAGITHVGVLRVLERLEGKK